MRRKLIKINRLKKKAEAEFHKFILRRDKYICFTCFGIANQAGHFCHNRLDFCEDNLRAQCVRCNHFLSGNLGEYAIRLDKYYGVGTAENLIARSHKESNKFSREQLNEFYEKYKKLNCER